MPYLTTEEIYREVDNLDQAFQAWCRKWPMANAIENPNDATKPYTPTYLHISKGIVQECRGTKENIRRQTECSHHRWYPWQRGHTARGG